MSENFRHIALNLWAENQYVISMTSFKKYTLGKLAIGLLLYLHILLVCLVLKLIIFRHLLSLKVALRKKYIKNTFSMKKFTECNALATRLHKPSFTCSKKFFAGIMKNSVNLPRFYVLDARPQEKNTKV